ncbi:MAG: endopeptidase La [Deltaproteobacteria bacterium]|nr:endopeptidase La [Deltaproteobacteria bacterium]
MAQSKRKAANKTKKPKAGGKKVVTLALLPSKDFVPIPGLLIPIYIGKGPATEAVEEALKGDKTVVLALQAGETNPDTALTDIYSMGGAALIVHSVKLPNGDYKIRLHVLSRVFIEKCLTQEPYIRCRVRYITPPIETRLSAKDQKLIEQVKADLAILAQYDQSLEEHVFTCKDIFDPGSLADLVCSVLPLASIEVQQVLEELDGLKRLKIVAKHLRRQADVGAVKERVAQKVQSQFEKAQREEILREQIRQIRAELGEGSDDDSELDDLKKQLDEINMPQSGKKEAQKQLRRLRQLHPDTSEAALARTYLDWIVDIPWEERTVDHLDLGEVRQVLDEDHYGLQETKERVLDYLGVRRIKKDLRGPILLLVGPPGVGKTSLGRSIARALDRKFVRVSIGGLRDEAELRGHRRTYVGALPGRIIQSLKTVGVKNPVFMLDEIDKVGADYRGDPAAVLLEILDPEQNKEFEDHYLNLPFDLSEVMFICTANITDTIPPALLDRMESINISGYTTEEKLQIARRYLIKRGAEENGLAKHKISFPDGAMLFLIEGYTRESGVRELGRHVNTVFRKLARMVAEGKKLPGEVKPAQLEEFLGPIKYLADKQQNVDRIGVVNGLAWTSVGGEIMTIEAVRTKGKGSLSLTGQMGEVMRESAMAALTYVQANAEKFGINLEVFESSNVHVHVPQGAIPKDGPSAGVAISTALVSLFTGKLVSKNVAMTGEITLSGQVIEIGGLKEKALAALRANIPVVIIPKDNERELAKFPKYLCDKVTFITVETIEEAMQAALLPGENL